MQRNIGSDILDTFKKFSQKAILKNYVSKKEYTGAEAIATVEKIAINLIAENCVESSRIAIYSQNCAEWALVDIACMQTRIVSVPIFATNNALQTDFILNNSNATLIFVGGQDQYDHIMQIERNNEFKIIVFDNKVELKTPTSIYFSEWIERNNVKDYSAELENRRNNIKEDDLVTLIYTSGTTGVSKGVELRHTQINNMIDNHNIVYEFKPEYTSIAFLPLSHIFERGWSYIVLSNGMTNIYLEDPKLIAEAIPKIKPETFCAVPRLYEKIHDKIMDNVKNQSLLKQKIFYWSVEQGKKRVEYQEKKKSMPSFLSLKYKLADKLVFSKIRKSLGGNLIICPCGGAYIPDELVLFFRGIGLPLLVGYGLSETSATVTSFTEDKFKVGTVGKPIAGVEIKIGEDNEILVKGKTVTSGYYKLEKETKELFTEDGWLKTGDAGHIDEEGYLVITDRIKQLIKTANGKYLAPQLIEGHLTQSPFISQAMVVGEGKPYASALLTLDKERVTNWAKKKNISYNNFEELAENKRLLQSIERSITKKQISLSNYEKVKKFKVLPFEFTMENEELTPTLKLKRKVIHEKYAKEINSLYS